MGNGLEEDYFASIRDLLNPRQVGPWEHTYKGSQFGLFVTRTCRDCNAEKKEEEFFKTKAGYYYPQCRVCDATRQRIKRAIRKGSMVNL